MKNDQLEWHHICSAPRDGTEFEAKVDGWAPFVAYYDGRLDLFLSQDPDDGPISYHPHFWRPLAKGAENDCLGV